MKQIVEEWLEARRKYWTRHDAHLWVRHDAWRFAPPGTPLYTGRDAVKYGEPNYGQPSEDERRQAQAEQDERLRDALDLKAEISALRAELRQQRLADELEDKREADRSWQRFVQKVKAGFNPSQPRVPAGNPDGGQWTSEGSRSDPLGRADPRIISDITPENDWLPGAQYAQDRNRSGPIIINGQLVQPTPGQAARLTVAESQAQAGMARVRELDPNWRPQQSSYNTVEGLIATYRAEAREANARIEELARNGIGPGPFARESIPARGPERDFTILERNEINRIGAKTGCHTCGTSTAETRSGNFIPDHQIPNAINPLGRAQRLYPHCLSCSSLEPIQEVWIQRQLFDLVKRRSMMRIMARRMKAATVLA
jgi:hypothetical protein